eukprot:3925686-Pleurochrysis_carterae.AAC.1
MLLRLIDLRPAEDVPHIINRMILLAFPVDVREQLRALSAMQQESYLAKRALMKQMSTDIFNPSNTLEARLENFWPTRAIERANTVFSKCQRADGSCKPRTLVPLPKAPRKSNRALGIYVPL